MDDEIGLDLSAILDPEQINQIEAEGATDDNKGGTQPKESNIDDNTITEGTNVGIEDLFPESVGDGGKKENKPKDEKNITPPVKDDGNSPKDNFYSSIAKSLIVDGVLSNLNDDDAAKVSTAEDLSELFNKQVESRLDETQKRINDALVHNINPDDIQMFENSINNLSNIKDEDISDESQKGENLRKSLIYSDFINRGYNKDKALELTQRSFDDKKDLDDAKYALQNNLDFVKTKYKEFREDASRKATEEANSRKQSAEELRKSILNDDKAFNEVQVDANTRQKIYDAINKPVAKLDDGTPISELQKYESEHHNDFMKYLGYFYVITNGFKSLDNVSKAVERKVKNRGLKELEHTLNSTSRNPDGSMKFVTGVDDNPLLSDGWSIDLK